MDRVVFQKRDQKQMATRGMAQDAVCAQIEMFQRGFPFATLKKPCTVGDGITVIKPQDMAHLTDLYAEATASGRVQKFVPASGAASRMFQPLLAVQGRYTHIKPGSLDASNPQDATLKAYAQFAERIHDFAFYHDLCHALTEKGHDLTTLLANGQCGPILETLLTPSGLNYANLPKALLAFHRYPDHCRTPLEEHLVEAISLVRDRHQFARLHFTVTPAHGEAMRDHFQRVRHRYAKSDTRYELTWSTQKPSTDTIAVDLDNQPFRDDSGDLVFRPGGHGALLENLNDLNGDLLLIKNIDNVVPDHLKADTYTWTQLLGGSLIALQQQIFDYIQQLTTGGVNSDAQQDMAAFAKEKLSATLPDTPARSFDQQRDWLLSIFNRPIRVCGVVPNTGEPGGGPFWVEHNDGAMSLQIVETSQVDMNDAEQRAHLRASTHFNPVHLVCGVRDYQGRPFDLRRFVDPETGFISAKSYQGRSLKALELPGLWNGAMAHWNTVFVELPVSTFNPVKTVFDLLRPEHQPA